MRQKWQGGLGRMRATACANAQVLSLDLLDLLVVLGAAWPGRPLGGAQPGRLRSGIARVVTGEGEAGRPA